MDKVIKGLRKIKNVSIVREEIDRPDWLESSVTYDFVISSKKTITVIPKNITAAFIFGLLYPNEDRGYRPDAPVECSIDRNFYRFNWYGDCYTLTIL